jgi:threonine dehydrogenase-like Zn-dependent dehydrogenase
MAGEVRAMVQTGVEQLELRGFARPEIGPDEALLRVEACGICGTDVETLAGVIAMPVPAIPGHEPVGVIEDIGARAARRWGLVPGDRVVVQSDFGCGRCHGCMEGLACKVAPGTHGLMPTSTPPALWGGYAELMYLAPGSVPHRISKHVMPRIAALYNPLGAGFAWAVSAGRLKPGQSIAIFGPGQRGLACAIAAAASGAGRIFVTGLGSRDGHKLALARELGADVTIDVEREDVRERIADETGGRGVDVSVDTTPHATGPVIDAIHTTRRGGTIVLAGHKGREHPVPAFPSEEVAVRQQTLRGVRAVDYPSFRQAIALIESGRVPVEKLHTHHFPLESAAEAVHTLADAGKHGAISITVEP